MNEPLMEEPQSEEENAPLFQMTPIGAHLFYICLLPLLMLLSHRNIVAALMLMGVAAAFHAGAFTALRGVFRASHVKEAAPRAALLWLLIFSLYSLVSTIWTPLPERWFWSVQIFLLFLISGAALWMAQSIPDEAQNKLAGWFAVMVILAAVLLGIEGLSGGWFRDVIPPDSARPAKDIIAAARGTNIAILLFFPAALIALKGGGVFATMAQNMRLFLVVLAAGGLLAAALTLTVAANVGALIAGGIAATFGFFLPRLALRLMIMGFVAALFLTPALALWLPPIDQLTQIDSGPVSWVQRLNIWRYTADFIFSSPVMFLFGGGVNFAWALSETGNTIQIPGHGWALSLMPTHPHNLFLQIWLEFGLVGALMVLGAVVQAGRWVLRCAPNAALSATLCGIGAAFMVYALVDMSLWTPWRFAALAFSLYGLTLAWRRVS